MIISQVFLQQQQQQNTPHFIVYFSENQKIKKNTNKKVRRAIKMNDALTIKLCTSKENKKQKLYIGQLPQHLTTS